MNLTITVTGTGASIKAIHTAYVFQDKRKSGQKKTH